MTDTQALIDRYYAAFNNRDWEAYGDLFLANAVTKAAGGVEAQGPAAILDFDRSWATAFPDARITSLHKSAVGGSIVVSENRFSGTHTGPLQTAAGEVSATGRSIEIPYAAVFEVDGDKLKAQRIYYDQLEVQSQLDAS